MTQAQTEIQAPVATTVCATDTETLSAPLHVDTKWARVSAAAYATALAQARGCYQRAVIAGKEAISGSTLRGTAASYGGHYARSRKTLIARLRKAGLSVEIVKEDRRHVLIVTKLLTNSSAACDK